MKGFQLTVLLPSGSRDAYVTDAGWLARQLERRRCEVVTALVTGLPKLGRLAVVVCAMGECPPKATLAEWTELRRWTSCQETRFADLTSVDWRRGDGATEIEGSGGA